MCFYTSIQDKKNVFLILIWRTSRIIIVLLYLPSRRENIVDICKPRYIYIYYIYTRILFAERITTDICRSFGILKRVHKSDDLYKNVAAKHCFRPSSLDFPRPAARVAVCAGPRIISRTAIKNGKV